MRAFKVEYIGKMNLYLSLLDRLEKGEKKSFQRHYSLYGQGSSRCGDRLAGYQLLLQKEQLKILIVNEINDYEKSDLRELIFLKAPNKLFFFSLPGSTVTDMSSGHFCKEWPG